MSIIIHGLDMPKEYGTAVGIYPNRLCIVFTEKEVKMDEHIWAEQPPPHGRLIDADKILDNVMGAMRHYNYDETRVLTLASVMRMIEAAPTIIEEEEPTIIEAEGVKE